MLEECDENKDGSCQFPEFLLLISRMQESNFCGMNDAAADRVKLEEEAGEKKRKAMQRKEGGRTMQRTIRSPCSGRRGVGRCVQISEVNVFHESFVCLKFLSFDPKM